MRAVQWHDKLIRECEMAAIYNKNKSTRVRGNGAAHTIIGHLVTKEEQKGGWGKNKSRHRLATWGGARKSGSRLSSLSQQDKIPAEFQQKTNDRQKCCKKMLHGKRQNSVVEKEGLRCYMYQKLRLYLKVTLYRGIRTVTARSGYYRVLDLRM